SMNRKKVTEFFIFWGLNVAAAYLPAFLYMPDLLGPTSDEWALLFAPVLLPALLLSLSNAVVYWCTLLYFFVMLGLVSAGLCRSRKAWFLLPCFVAVYSLLQGLLAAHIIHGIDGIGHS